MQTTSGLQGIIYSFNCQTPELLHEHGVESINAYVNKLIEAEMLKNNTDPDGKKDQE